MPRFEALAQDSASVGKLNKLKVLPSLQRQNRFGHSESDLSFGQTGFGFSAATSEIAKARAMLSNDSKIASPSLTRINTNGRGIGTFRGGPSSPLKKVLSKAAKEIMERERKNELLHMSHNLQDGTGMKSITKHVGSERGRGRSLNSNNFEANRMSLNRRKEATTFDAEAFQKNWASAQNNNSVIRSRGLEETSSFGDVSVRNTTKKKKSPSKKHSKRKRKKTAAAITIQRGWKTMREKNNQSITNKEIIKVPKTSKQSSELPKANELNNSNKEMNEMNEIAIIKLQSTIRGFIDRSRVNLMKQAKDAGVMVAMKGTKQGKSGRYQDFDGQQYFFAVDPEGTWWQVLKKSEYTEREAELEGVPVLVCHENTKLGTAGKYREYGIENPRKKYKKWKILDTGIWLRK